MSPEPLNVYTPRICLDFDGVVHSYTSGWKGATVIPDPPTEDAFTAITDYMAAGLEVCIFSSRSHIPGGIEAMRDWFILHGWPPSVLDRLKFPKEKPPAILYVDDRGWMFTGTNWPTVEAVRGFEPWTKQPQANPVE